MQLAKFSMEGFCQLYPTRPLADFVLLSSIIPFLPFIKFENCFDECVNALTKILAGSNLKMVLRIPFITTDDAK
jgi:hypothetical protein